MKTLNKVFGILAAFLMLFGSMGAASAASTANIGTNVTIPVQIGLGVDKTTQTYVLNIPGSYASPSEGSPTYSNSGNVPISIFMKLAAPSNIIYQQQGGTLFVVTTEDQKISDLVIGGTLIGAIRAKYNVGTTPGNFMDTLVVTAMQQV